MKLFGDSLWSDATANNLEEFSKQLRRTKAEIEKSVLFIEDKHYTELTILLNFFSEYLLGKSKLIDYQQNLEGFDHQTVMSMINNNLDKKTQYETLIRQIRASLKNQLKG